MKNLKWKKIKASLLNNSKKINLKMMNENKD